MSEGGGDGSDLALLGVLGAAAAGGFAVVAVRRRRRAAAELADVKAAAEEDLVALAEDVHALELDVELPGADPRAKEHYGHAVRAYERASEAFRRARSTRDVETVTGAVDEGRYAMASARARLEGREPPGAAAAVLLRPPARPLCHGRSSGSRPTASRGPCRRARRAPSASSAAWSRTRARCPWAAGARPGGTRARPTPAGRAGSTAAPPACSCLRSSWARCSAPGWATAPGTASAPTASGGEGRRRRRLRRRRLRRLRRRRLRRRGLRRRRLPAVLRPGNDPRKRLRVRYTQPRLAA